MTKLVSAYKDQLAPLQIDYFEWECGKFYIKTLFNLHHSLMASCVMGRYYLLDHQFNSSVGAALCGFCKLFRLSQLVDRGICIRIQYWIW